MFSQSGSTGVDYRDHRGGILNFFNGGGPDLANTTLQSQGFQQRAHVGKLPGQPLTVAESKKPIIPVFFQVTGAEYGFSTATLNKEIQNVVTVGLAKIVITGLQVSSNGNIAYALQIESSGMSNHLRAKTIHSFPNLNDHVLFFDYNFSGNLIQDYLGEPALIWQTREAGNLKDIKIALVDTNTGLPVTFTNAYLWLYVQTLNWQ